MFHIILWYISSATAHAQWISSALTDSIPSGAAAGAATGSIIPGLGTLVGGALGGVASGLLGLFGANQQNTANSNSVDQAEAYNTEMSDTTYQRTVADMKAAGINPMFLAMGASSDSSPTSPTYTATNTLNQFSSTASDLADLYPKMQQSAIAAAKLQQEQAEASVSSDKAQAELDTAQANAVKMGAAANIATQTQQDSIDTADAQTAKAKADAHSAGVDADWATTNQWLHGINNVSNTAKDVLEGFGIGKYLRRLKTYNPSTTGTFDKGTGEIH